MTQINKTLYIPLYGKALVSRKGILLSDKMAEEIWKTEGFPLQGKSKSKWLAWFMAMRAAVFDRWLMQQMTAQQDAVVLHIGCGLDSRCVRVGCNGHPWYDVDFPEVIAARRKYYTESEQYHMIEGDARKSAWLSAISSGGNAIVIFEGISMYLQPEELRTFLQMLSKHFRSVSILMDCYTTKGAKATKIRNPINDVGVTQSYGMDDPHELEGDTGFLFICEHDMTPPELIGELSGIEKAIFRTLFAGRFSKSIYRMYEFKSGIIEKERSK